VPGAAAPWVDAPIDVHLMVKPVERIVPEFATTGADYITFHPEASEHMDRTLQLIREQGCRAGLAGGYSNVRSQSTVSHSSTLGRARS